MHLHAQFNMSANPNKRIQQEKILEGLRVGLSYATAAKAAGVGKGCMYLWRREEPVFAEACDMAESVAVKYYADQLKKCADTGNASAIMYFLTKRSEEFKDGIDVKTLSALQQLLSLLSNEGTLIPLPIPKLPIQQHPKQQESKSTTTVDVSGTVHEPDRQKGQ
jgi:hypothetical protein